MVIIIILYVGMGLFGFLRYGSDVKGNTFKIFSSKLKLNSLRFIRFDYFKSSVKRHVSFLQLIGTFNPWFWLPIIFFYRKAQAVQGMLAFAIFISHGLACYVAIDIIWNEHLSHKFTNSKRLWEYTTRTLLVFFTCKRSKAHKFIKWLIIYFLSLTSCRYSEPWVIHQSLWCSVLVRYAIYLSNLIKSSAKSTFQSN